MASLYKRAAAVCLVALSALQSAAAATKITYKFTPVVVDDACYVGANLVRNGKLPVRISTVTKDEIIAASLEKKLVAKTNEKTEEAPSDPECNELTEIAGLKDIFHHTFDYEGSLNYRELLQTALNNGLEVFKKNKDEKNWETIWGNDAGGSLAYLLGANSTAIGCVIGQCTTASNAVSGERDLTPSQAVKAVLFCELSPAAKKGQAPFDDEYFDGLIARTAKLEEMTEEDLKANDGTAAASIPTILAACLVAMLTVVSA